MQRGRPKRQKEEREEAPSALPLSTKFLRALREDIMRHHKVKRQLDMDHTSVEDLSIVWHVETPEPRAIPLYRAASDRYRIEVNHEFKPIRFSIAV